MNSKLSGSTEPGLHGTNAVRTSYEPAIDDHARALIERIRRNHTDIEAVQALAAHYESHDDLPSLANLMEGWASTLGDDRKAADAFLRAAWAVANGLGDFAREQVLYERAIERFPEHPSALAMLEARLKERGDDAALERVLKHALDALSQRLVDPKLRAGIHQRLAHVHEQLGQPHAAIEQYRAALELDSSSIDVIAAARAIYHQSGKAGPVADMYELEISVTDDDDQRSALLRALAEHRRDALADLDGAILTLRRALKRAPSDLATIERLAELLRERCRRVGAETADSDADRVRAAELYFQLARNVPRREASHRLLACLRLEPEHSRAKAMLAELEAYGAGPNTAPPDPHLSQAELEGKATGRYAPEPDATAANALSAEPRSELDEYEAWVNDDEITELEDDVGVERMVPISERPPPPPAPGKPSGTNSGHSSGRRRRFLA